MPVSSAEQLRQFMNRRNAENAQSPLGRYQQELNARSTQSPTGMLNPQGFQTNLAYDPSQFVLSKSPQQPQPSGGGMSVLCTLMHKYGYLEDDVFKADTLYGEITQLSSPEIVIGYHAWAKPLVAMLENHPIAIPTFAYFVQAWAYLMAEEFGIVKNRSTFKRLVGKIVMTLGKPLCGFIGHIILFTQGSYEYRRT